jgi:hypothetical protein
VPWVRCVREGGWGRSRETHLVLVEIERTSGDGSGSGGCSDDGGCSGCSSSGIGSSSLGGLLLCDGGLDLGLDRSCLLALLTFLALLALLLLVVVSIVGKRKGFGCVP